MLTGDCNVCINNKLPSYSATCVECGLSRKNYKPITKLAETGGRVMKFTCEKCGWWADVNGVCICGYSGRPTTRNDSCMAWKTSIVTIADKIRSMTDEELAEWLCDISGWLPMYEGKMHPILDWLRREAE